MCTFRPSELGQFRVALSLGSSTLLWVCTPAGPCGVSVVEGSVQAAPGIAVVDVCDIFNAAAGVSATASSTSRPRVVSIMFPKRFFILGFLTYDSSNAHSVGAPDASHTIAMTAIGLRFDPLDLVLIVRGHEVDSWTKAVGLHIDAMHNDSTSASVPLPQHLSWLRFYYSREPTSAPPFMFGENCRCRLALRGGIATQPLLFILSCRRDSHAYGNRSFFNSSTCYQRCASVR